MQNLRYVGKNLFIEKLSIKNILKKQKTPFYIYSENQIITNFLKFKNTFNNFQKEVSSVTKDVNLEDEVIQKNKIKKQDLDKNG